MSKKQPQPSKPPSKGLFDIKIDVNAKEFQKMLQDLQRQLEDSILYANMRGILNQPDPYSSLPTYKDPPVGITRTAQTKADRSRRSSIDYDLERQRRANERILEDAFTRGMDYLNEKLRKRFPDVGFEGYRVGGRVNLFVWKRNDVNTRRDLSCLLNEIQSEATLEELLAECYLLLGGDEDLKDE